jgi:hypothetical protein
MNNGPMFYYNVWHDSSVFYVYACIVPEDDPEIGTKHVVGKYEKTIAPG